MRLHVGKTTLEELLGALDCQRLGLVHVLATAIVTVAGVAFSVLVGEYAACGSGHRDHTSVPTPERRARLISWGLPRQQGRSLTKVNERTGEWGISLPVARCGRSSDVRD